MSTVHEIDKSATEPAACRLPIRVCYMIDRLGIGGTETQLLALLRQLNRSQVEPSLCLLDGNDPVSRSLEPPNCPVIRLGVRSLWRPRSWRKTIELASFLRRQQVDVLQVHFADSTYLGVAAAMLARVPCVVRTRRALVHWTTFVHHRLGKRLDALYNRLCVDAMLTNSEACRQAVLEQEHPSPRWIEVVSNGIDLQRFAHARPQAREVQRRVGIVAVLRPVKNLDLFVRAARIICDTEPNVSFFIAGEGFVRPVLENLIRELKLTDRVALLGQVLDVPGFLATLDVAVLCSRSEGLPNAVLEYMAAGKAIVATNVGGTPELLQHEQSGLLVPPNDPYAIAEGVLRLLREPELASRLGEAAQQRAQEYSFEQVARRYEQFYQKLVQRSPAYRRRHFPRHTRNGWQRHSKLVAEP